VTKLAEKEEIREVKFIEEIAVKTKDTKTFKRRDSVMIKSHKLFYPPTLNHKAWYGPFEVTRICKNNCVEIKDHTRWFAKVPTNEVMHLRDYIQRLDNRTDEPAPKRSKIIT
jgi:hypothetical protein